MSGPKDTSRSSQGETAIQTESLAEAGGRILRKKEKGKAGTA